MNIELIILIKEAISAVLPDICMSSKEYDKNLQELGMNSLEFIQIIVLLEEKLSIEIPDEYLLITQMNTIRKIYNVLISLK